MELIAQISTARRKPVHKLIGKSEKIDGNVEHLQPLVIEGSHGSPPIREREREREGERAKPSAS
jgi:hypothetical protein